jgi:hypothetical protein
MTSTDNGGRRDESDRRAADRRTKARPFSGPDRRAEERRSGRDRRTDPR